LKKDIDLLQKKIDKKKEIIVPNTKQKNFDKKLQKEEAKLKTMNQQMAKVTKNLIK
jgi:hypothetical protein